VVVSGPRTLCVDIGGSTIKAAVLDHTGSVVSECLRIPTPYPLPPHELATIVRSTAERLGVHDRVSVGFPGMVRAGRVLTAPFFVTTAGPGSDAAPELVSAWQGFDLQAALTRWLDRPARVANDADVHGAAIVVGRGLELVITLGTGFGTGLFLEGQVCPHLELAHHPFREGESYNAQLGDAARRRVGTATWSDRVLLALDTLRALLHYDHAWLGGGNARHLTSALPPDASVVTDDAGLVGGVRLWQGDDAAAGRSVGSVAFED
jgi:polyphosphate glucokinase